LNAELVTIGAKLKEIDQNINNLGIALAGESNTKLQHFIKQQLTNALDQQEQLETDKKEG
jgi:hypothetical protein